MTLEEVNNALYFRMRLHFEGAVVASRDIYYKDDGGITEGVFTVTHTTASGRTITLSIDGRMQTTPSIGEVYPKKCTVTTNGTFLVRFRGTLNQVSTYDGTSSGYNIVISNRHFKTEIIRATNTTTRELKPENQTLWDTDTTTNKLNFGGQVDAFVHIPTGLPVRHSDGKLVRHSDGKIVRDD